MAHVHLPLTYCMFGLLAQYCSSVCAGGGEVPEVPVSSGVVCELGGDGVLDPPSVVPDVPATQDVLSAFSVYPDLHWPVIGSQGDGFSSHFPPSGRQCVASPFSEHVTFGVPPHSEVQHEHASL